MKALFIVIMTTLLGGCMASIPVLGPAVGTVTDDRVVTGMSGAYACAKMAESIGDPSLRRQVQWNCQKGVDARGRQVAANMPNTHCRETISYDANGNARSTMTCTSSQGVIRSTDRVRSGLPR